MGSSIVNQPGITINLLGDTTTVQNSAQRVLVVGQQLAAGTATSGELQEQIFNDSSEDTLFGEASHLAMMVRAFKLNNKVTRIDAIGLDDAGGGTAATGTIVIAGTTATADGAFVVTIGSDRNHSYTIAVPATSDPTAVGDLIEAAVNADTKNPVTAANVTGTVTMTAVHAGTIGNTIGLRITGSIPALTHSVTAMASGATDPTLTTLFDVVATERYQTVVYPLSWGIDDLTDFLDPRFNIAGQLLDGIGIVADSDTFSNINTAAGLLNSESVIMLGTKLVSNTSYKGPSLMELDDSLAAQFAALRSLRLTTDASIADIVSAATGPRDSFGGVHLSSKPYFNTPFQFLPLVGTGLGFSNAEIETLVTSGASILGNNISGTSIIAGEIVTTFKTDAAGNPDVSFKFANSVDTGTNVREYFFNNVRKQYTQSRLTDGDLIPGVSSANEQSIRAFLTGLYNDMTGPTFALTRSGEDNLNIFKDNLSVDLTLSSGLVTGDMVVPIVVQFRQFNGTVRIKF